MRVATLVKILAGLVVLAVIAIVVAVLVIDANEYKDEIIAAVETETGRAFAIDSDIDLKIGLTPSFAVSGVTLANAEWGSRPELLTVGEFAAEVALIPLIFGDLQINRLILRDADILIETDAEGRGNFELSKSAGKRNPGRAGRGLPQINDVLVENATVTVIDGANGTTQKLVIRRLSAHADSLSSPLALDLDAVATLDNQDIPFGAEGTVGAPGSLMSSGQPYPLDLRITGLGMTASIKGALTHVENTAGFDLTFDLSGDNLQGLAPITGDGLPATGAVAITAALKGDRATARFENLEVRVGNSDVSGSAAIEMRGPRPRVVAALQSTTFDLTELLPADATAAAAPRPAADGGAGGSGAAVKLFSAQPIPFAILTLFDAKVDFAIASLVAHGATIGNASGTLVLDNGSLVVTSLKAVVAGSELDGSIGIDTRSGAAAVALEVKAPMFDVGQALRDFAGLDALRGTGAVDISLRGSGGSVAEIMATLNGHSRLLMNQGEMRNDFLGNISGLTQTLGEAFGKKEWIAVECIASDFDVARGIARSRVNVINTELLLITADGQVDLGAEKPDLEVTPRPKGIDLSLAVPVDIGGSLANPTFMPDTLATARKVGGLLGAIAFPPAALLGLAELGSDENPCLRAASDEGAAAPPRSEPASPVEAVTDSAKDAVEDVGKGIRKLFGN